MRFLRLRILGLVAGSVLLMGPLAHAQSESSSPRDRMRFTGDWHFHLGDVPAAKNPAFDDSDWRSLDLPHDWSVEGDFSEEHPAGAGGGYLPGGVGWYRKTFSISEERRGKRVFIDFDGVYRNSEVWINGHYLGQRPFGYASFRYELTSHLNYGEGEGNVIAVRVDNSDQPNSRWYSGSGIYRNVWLVATNRVHVDHWGTYVTTPHVNDEVAYVSARTQVRNDYADDERVTVRTVIRDEEGRAVADSATTRSILSDSVRKVEQNVAVQEPLLWSPEDPHLYTAVTTIEHEGETVDRYTTPFGIRYFRFDSNDGFFLNGERLQIRGVCEHHDLGSLGAAVNRRAIERRLEILKDMGVNAIRTAHNPPSPELLELTDEMGFLVMDEAFDVWAQSKVEHDYSMFWDEWHEEDLRALIRRDRNHPSIIAWSIGNEILEQWGDSSGVAITRDLARTVRELDDTRPITAGLNGPQPHNPVIRSGALDVIGYNYHNELFADFPDTFPGDAFIATEAASALGTRGAYDLPSDSIRRWPEAWDEPFTAGNEDHTVSAYDNVSTPWGSTHEEILRSMEGGDYLSGLFLWTGFDYIGEPTPYEWPSRSSYFGIIDLAGFPKDAYYLFKSEWTDEPVLHLFPHWNWKGVSQDTVDVWAYTNARDVELYLNGESLGRQKMTGDETHLLWRVPWEPGSLRAVGRAQDGDRITDVVQTAGVPAQIALSADRDTIAGDGRDLSFVQVTILDDDGVMVPTADTRVEFDVSGPGKIAGVSSGDPTSHEPFKADHRRAFNGRAQVTVQSTGSQGEITVTAQGKGVEEASVTIRADE